MAKKRNGVKPPKNETRDVKFVRVVTPRVSKAVKSILLIGNCAGAGYLYSPAQVKQLLKALEDACTTVANKFANVRSETQAFEFQA